MIPGGEDIKDRSGKIVGFKGMPCFTASGLLHLDIPALTFSQETSEPCGNDMIDAHVGTLLDSKLPTGFPQSLGKVSDFSTIIWITATQLPTLPQSLLLLFFLIFKKRKRMFMMKIADRANFVTYVIVTDRQLTIDLKLPLWYLLIRDLDEWVSGSLFPERWHFSPEYAWTLEKSRKSCSILWK